MTNQALAIAALTTLVLAVFACKGDSETRPVPSRRPLADSFDAARARRLPKPMKPDWRVRVTDEPGMPVLQRSAGPVLSPSAVVVASSAIGFAVLSRETGEVTWQRRGED